MAHTIPFMKKSTTKLLTPIRTQARILSSNLMALLSLVVILGASSCTTYKDLQYLQGEIDSVKYSQFKVPEQRIQKGDQLSIMVYSDNAAASSLFNTGSVPTAQAGSVPNSGGAAMQGGGTLYDVDLEGKIFFPQIGVLPVEGLTKEELKQLLNSKLKDSSLFNPYYVIRFQNLRFTVFGEVNSPGVYPITKGNLNIFEAITAAGDLSNFGKRENILVIRENNGKREFGRIDITKPDVFSSPYYYLQQNDMIMVDMRKQKIAASDQALFRNITVLFSLVSAVALFTQFLR